MKEKSIFRHNIIIWVNIILQISFPLSMSFSPTASASTFDSKSHLSTISGIETETYTLHANENVEFIAKKFNLTVLELKQLNNYRTFSKPFMSLTAGDEIDVPSQQPLLSINNEKDTNTDTHLENKLADYAQTGAMVLGSDNAAKSGERMLRSAVKNEFNSSAQQWLSQFGTARVQINVNDDFELDGSTVDMLVPIYDDQKSILFTQLGARKKDSRNTVNIGAGVRTFQNNWMYGVNTFFDNDITGKNRRVGVGAEAWTDYLKLSANSYIGTSDWHQSRDFADYNERPANGYDVRAEAWLPSYPQLGGKLMYEKYLGEEVALFGKDNRQKNPQAVTVGINYTPIPLLTVGAEHRGGNGNNNDSSINVQLNYRIGDSWQSHIDPSAVASSRTLAASRYDLVERNNNIVLDYQKQQLLNLNLPLQLTEQEGNVAPLTAQVTAKYGLSKIDWDTTALIAAGGAVTQTSLTTVSVTFPPYQTNGNNSYILSAVARDTQNNISNRAITTINVTPTENSSSTVTLTLLDDNALANGIDTNRVQVDVISANGSGVANQVVNFTADNGANITSSTLTNAQGVATATLTNLAAGVSTVTSTVNGSSQSVPTTFVADNSTAVITSGNLTVTSDNALANGTATN
ncbi:TPA: YrIlm family inverse autotransporter adhesin, partial [Yersinia enterocolitica]